MSTTIRSHVAGRVRLEFDPRQLADRDPQRRRRRDVGSPLRDGHERYDHEDHDESGSGTQMPRSEADSRPAFERARASGGCARTSRRARPVTIEPRARWCNAPPRCEGSPRLRCEHAPAAACRRLSSQGLTSFEVRTGPLACRSASRAAHSCGTAPDLHRLPRTRAEVGRYHAPSAAAPRQAARPQPALRLVYSARLARGSRMGQLTWN